jgi:phosphoglycerate dehydrogenase-like enzyme
MATVICLGPFEKPYRELFEKALVSFKVIFANSEADIDGETASTAEALIGLPNPGTIGRYESLKWVQLFAAGINAYTCLAQTGIIVTNATGAYGQAVSEHMAALTIALFKRLHQYRDEQNKREWKGRGTVRSIKGSTALVVGLGNIGGEYAKTMKALGAYVIGVRRMVKDKPDFVDELVLHEDIDKVLPRADIVALIVPNTDKTVGLFNRERIAKMKKGAVLVNAGRGNVVDQDALADALESGALSGAGLDVTDPEPLPSDHRLWRVENAFITPHVSGGFNLRETYEGVMSICIDNAARYAQGQPLQNIVDFEAGYRKRG